MSETPSVRVGLESSLFSSDFGANLVRRLTLDDDGNLRIYSFNPASGNPASGQWVIGWEAIPEPCTIHGTCGPNSICITDGVNNTPSCICPPRFRPLSDVVNGGCERNIPLTENTKFIRLDYVNFSDRSNPTGIDSYSFTACQGQCLSDPKCLAFSFKYGLASGFEPGYCMLQLERLLNGY
ncbi:hypothetical protein Vadar_023984 [Vaccinium darrowii]|uniref:Uncharacterized protein n=1 Tax=Vaccinium darrowii TaxID=229202 RepID=A0ACB7Y1B1_9ERIC|nr:hypothetical protein Vadar_023984 [Vaccinium darrowii]